MHRTYYKALLATTLTIVFQICSGFGAWRNNNSPVRIVSTQKLHATRREFCAAIACTTVGVFGTSLNIEEAGAVNDDFFRSGGYGKEEYTNAFTASRDTNISPKEAYDSISSDFLLYPVQKAMQMNRIPRALDVGAGAGVSTQILYEMGYKSLDAVDWSGSAWDRFVVNDPIGNCPSSVKFFELDDERFKAYWQKERMQTYDAIVFNFAVNEDKAKAFASELLTDQNSRLLAPVNTQKDYWLKQTYKCYDKEGTLLWQTNDVGAWSVQFQPDVTQDTCQGIWCAPFNGFKKMSSTSSSLF
mmetsp:Transcript_2111/g.2838  ORF Transcript_2111/g.2838 Transcript_2111/m.2838 type:complete len:300 (+) Transcript_2111:259-1158(+)|eukprot:CAMPEP_0116069454 /NCGR_PEP_ID=MMETSP0322-20121206/12313_1 /TAXON_ID=163516 /ORGANISM="Leptocylindrus danicus var. apora, Strain B651" /LENGTH=299 /DNA_ID=CAMNT_0003556853 /DNA_START=160 /DNA_END=1059 /DNA_ORIENTATION=-